MTCQLQYCNPVGNWNFQSLTLKICIKDHCSYWHNIQSSHAFRKEVFCLLQISFMFIVHKILLFVSDFSFVIRSVIDLKVNKPIKWLNSVLYFLHFLTSYTLDQISFDTSFILVIYRNFMLGYDYLVTNSTLWNFYTVFFWPHYTWVHSLFNDMFIREVPLAYFSQEAT